MLGLPSVGGTSALTPKKPGVIVGMDGSTVRKDRDGRPVAQIGGVPLIDRTRNPVFVTGPMGSGKTSLLYATLMDKEDGYSGSCVLWDYKRVMCDEVGAAREAMGHNVLVVDITKRGRGRVNPLQWIREGDDFVADCQLVATKMTERDTKSDDKSSHWINAAFSYMAGVIAYVMTAAPDSEKSLAGVRRHMIRGDEASLEMGRPGIHSLAVEAAEELWSQSLIWEPDADDPMSEESDDDRSLAYRKAIYTTCSAMLADFADPVLAAQTSVSDFEPADLACGDRPLTVIISTNPPTSNRLRKVFRLIFSQIIDRLTEEMKTVSGRRRVHDVLLAVDEFLQFGIKEVASWLTYFREYGVKPLFLAQSYEEIIDLHKRVIASSASWVSLAPMSVYEAEMMSRMVGEVETVIESQSKTRKYFWDRATVTDSTRTEFRPEITPSEFLDMDAEEIYIFGMGKVIHANRILAHCKYADCYGPASRQWTATATCNPWLGRVIPVPPREPKEQPEQPEQAASRTEAAAESGDDRRDLAALLDGYGEEEE